MKLLPLLLLICLDCRAQRDTVYVTDTIKYKDGGYRINLSDGNYRVTFPGGNGGYGSGAYKNLPVILPKKDTVPSIAFFTNNTERLRILPNYDTVRVVLLYSDTSNNHYWAVRDARWQYGYEVRENEPPIFYYDQGLIGKWATPFRHVSYLDDRRRALSKSIIVWQSIKL